MTKEFKRTVELNSDHEISGFDCGVPELDSWLRDLALRNQKENTSRTFVIADGENVVAFYCLAAANVERELLPSTKQRNSPRDVPLISLGRLAVAIEFQGLGLGALLVRDAIARSLAATEYDQMHLRRVNRRMMVCPMTDDQKMI